MCSSNPAPRRFIETPAASNSCSIQPWPTPTTSRPSVNRSSVASLREDDRALEECIEHAGT
jgi:hypothetical protein